MATPVIWRRSTPWLRIASSLLPRPRAPRGLARGGSQRSGGWDPMSVFPRYQGRSLLNLSPSVCHAFGVPAHGLAAPLVASVLPPRLLEGVTTVILLVVDGLGRQQLDDASREGDAPFLADLRDRAATSDDVTLSTI